MPAPVNYDMPNIARNQALAGEFMSRAGESIGRFASSVQSTKQDASKTQSIYSGLQNAVKKEGPTIGLDDNAQKSIIEDLAPREAEDAAAYEARVANHPALNNLAKFKVAREANPQLAVDPTSFSMPEKDFDGLLSARNRGFLTSPTSGQNSATGGIPATSGGTPILTAPGAAPRNPAAAASNITQRAPTATDGLSSASFANDNTDELQGVLDGVGKPADPQSALAEIGSKKQTTTADAMSRFDEIMNSPDEAALLKHEVQYHPDPNNDTSLWTKTYNLRRQQFKDQKAAADAEKKTDEEIRKTRAEQNGKPVPDRDKKTVSWQQYESTEGQLSRLKSGYVDSMGNKVAADPGQYELKAREALTNLISHNLEISGEKYDVAQQKALAAVDQAASRDDERKDQAFLYNKYDPNNPLKPLADSRMNGINMANPTGFKMLVDAAKNGYTATQLLEEIMKKKGLNPTRQ